MGKTNKFLPDLEILKKFNRAQKSLDLLNEVGDKIMIGTFIALIPLTLIAMFLKVSGNAKGIIFIGLLVACATIVTIVIFIHSRLSKYINRKSFRAYSHYSYLQSRGYKYYGYKIDVGNPQFIKVLYSRVVNDKELSSRTLEFDFKQFCFEEGFKNKEILEILEGGKFQYLHRIAMVEIMDKIDRDEAEANRREDEIIAKRIAKYWEKPSYGQSITEE